MNLHMIALPMHSSVTAQNMLEEFKTVFNVLCPDWKNRLLAITTDGKAKMTGQFNGFATHLEHECTNDLIHIWCGAHQLDLVVHWLYEHLFLDQFFCKLATLINYLHCQQLFKKEVKSCCPCICSTCWLSMSNVSQWLVKQRAAITNLLAKKQPDFDVDATFWIVLFFLNDIVSECAHTFRALQLPTLLIDTQESLLCGLVGRIINMFEQEGKENELAML